MRLSHCRFAAALLLFFASAAGAARPGSEGSTFDPEAYFRPGSDFIAGQFSASVAKCKQGVAADCARLSRRLTYVGTVPERDRMDDAFRAACVKGVNEACGAAAWSRMARVEATATDLVDGTKDLDKACAAGDPITCRRLIEVFTEGPRALRDAPRAKIIAQEQCPALGGPLCYEYAKMKVNDHKGTANDARDIELRTKACEGGDGRGCVDAAQAVGGARATELLKTGCDFDYAPACAKLGGTMVETACKMGDTKSCDERAAETKQYERYCALWGSEACSSAAKEIAKQQGEAAPHAEKIVALHVRAYLRGDEAMHKAVLRLIKDTEVACKTDHRKADACAFAGFSYLLGWNGVDAMTQASAARNAQAEHYLRYACDAGAKNSCLKADALKAAMK